MYTAQEVKQASLEYFNGDELAANVFQTKYALKNKQGEFLEKTPDDMHKRLAKEFARIEQKYPNPLSEEEIYEQFKGFKYIVPQGSPMYGIGNPYVNVSFSNCTVVASPEDNISSILDSAKEQANLQKRRCGVGMDLSTLRPDGANVNNSAETSTGAWSFADLYSFVCRMIGQNNRRGALMLTMDIRHPDVEKFITMKHDLSKVTGANVSVKISDEFMKAVENDQEFQLQWPVDSKEPKCKKMIKAKELWNTLINSVTKTAEPGLLMWGNITKNLPAHCYPDFKTVATNPCQPAWATVLTPSGIETFNNIDIGSIIWSGKQWAKITNKVMTGIKPVYAYRTKAGTFYGTENHKVVSNGIKIEAKDADSIDVSVGQNISNVTLNLKSVMDGLVVGDGSVHKASNNLVYLCIGKDDNDYFKDDINKFIVKERQGLAKTAWEIDTTIKFYELPKTFDREIPERFRFGSSAEKASFLRGLYSANGSVVSNRITLKSASIKIIEQAQEMLSSMGIVSYYTTNKKHTVEFNNGVYECKQSYDLNIGTRNSRAIFAKNIGFIQRYKQDKLLQTLEGDDLSNKCKMTYDIIEREYISNEEVYDITVDAEEHTYWTGGLLVSNCAELPLSAYDSCRLISINLKHFVNNSFEENSEFDFKKLQYVTFVAMKLSDDLVDLELEALENIIGISDTEDEKELWRKLYTSCRDGRRTGLGTHGLADALARLRLKYDSDAALDFVDKLYEIYKIAAYDTSRLLASQRGSFPAFNLDLEKDNEFIGRLPDWLQSDIEQEGRRNISLLTNAPTGTVSIVCQTSSGIEPVFRNSYTRRTKINHNDKSDKVDFVDQSGDKWLEFKVYHHNISEYVNKFNTTELPDYFITSEQIDWQKRVELQAVIQSHIDHSISSTINLPKGTTEETVREIYKQGWKKGLKGITVYVDGCRTGVLVENTDKDKQNKVEENNAVKRPQILPCEIHQVSVKGEKYTVLVGLLGDKPYEVFGGLSKFIDIPKQFVIGEIIKRKTKTQNFYDLKLKDGIVIKDIVNAFDNTNYALYTRMISLSLRHGIKVSFISEQLQKDPDEDMQSFSRVVARTLKKYIPSGTKVAASDKYCKSCNDYNLVYDEGCVRCLSCGYSKCS